MTPQLGVLDVEDVHSIGLRLLPTGGSRGATRVRRPTGDLARRAHHCDIGAAVVTYPRGVARALFIIDVQNDFTEGGALGVDGGDAAAERISRHLGRHADEYEIIVASRDWHDAVGDNGGHFSAQPDFSTTWPPHCLAGTPGADYDPGLDTSRITYHVKKGQGKPAYSLFEGITEDGRTVRDLLEEHGVTEVDVTGIATDYCVRASALDALAVGRRVRVFTDLVAGVSPDTSQRALAEIVQAGGSLASSGV